VPAAVEGLFKDYDKEASIPSWAIRFAASQPNVKMVLSGMGDMDMIKDNTGYMKDFKDLTEEEMNLVKRAADIINGAVAIPCTACAYCVDGCPKNIPIPKYFSLFNAEKQEYEGKGFTPQGEYYTRLTENFGKASDCIECGKCEKICPQHLPIREHLKAVAKQFE
jgi:predicted aldo/keto reductase-like oxidoreductase